MNEGFALVLSSRPFSFHLTFLFFLLEEVTLGLYFIVACPRSATVQSEWWRRGQDPC